MGEVSNSPGQIITLPKGGGAQHGLGEKFSPDLHTGTGNFTVPIAIPAGRNGFQPQLNLIYSTGNGNGLFGMGWNVSIPGVARKTSKGIPRYRDYDVDQTKRDVFILSGAEDLVPVADSSLNPLKATRYRPRTEGLFARIVHHHDATAAANFWEISSKDGLVSYYGSNPADQVVYHPDFRPHTTPATIVKPKISEETVDRIFAWKLTCTKDPFGNRIEYLYESRDQSAEQNQQSEHRWDQPLLTQIRYIDFQEDEQTKFLATVKFSYEDDRADPFSEYKAGFEIRTTQRCKSILIETHAGETRPVRKYEFIYENDPYNSVSVLRQIEVIGFDDQGNEYDGKVHNGLIREKQLPPLEFEYTQFDPSSRNFEVVTGIDLPSQSLSNSNMELVDLHGAGLPDILETNGVIRYWRNLGNRRFDLPRPMQDAPTGMELASVGVQLLDADGDGRTDLMISGDPLPGYFPLEFPAKWDRKSFQRYRDAPSFNLEDPEVRLIDLTGDGISDVLRSGTRLECFFNDQHEGWSPQNVQWVERQSLEFFPNVNFSDPRVKLADMTGDGMQDIVLVYDGNVEYWPNLGYGNWGKRIHMRNSPRFPSGYDPKRILVGDVDGDGLADIVYVDHNEVHLWINQSGNGWTKEPVIISGTPPVTDIDGLRLVDLQGTGISGVLWSTDRGRLGPRNLMFLDFTGGTKPYLLCRMNNHLGAVTDIEYKTSTYFYIEDEKKFATRWRTPLPFPVHVVAKVVVFDDISKGTLTTEYRYHHGYWDGAEREFRGFGMVEHRDSELIRRDGVADVHFSPPTLTRTWFHLGPVGPESGDWKEDLDWSSEFWDGDGPMLDHKEFVTPFLRTLGNNSPRSRRMRRDAIRTLRGTVIRTELYALDGSPNQNRPYTVTESQYGLQEIDPPDQNNPRRERIFFPHLRGQRTTQWERGDDPLTVFAFTDDYDDFGQPRRTTSVACPRGWRSIDDQPSENYLATRSRTRFASPAANGPYIHDRVSVTTSSEIRNSATQTVFDLRSMPDTDGSLRVITQTLNYYDGPEFVGLTGANFGRVGTYGALTRSEQLVFTDRDLNDAVRNTQFTIPPWLVRQNPNWTTEYPAGFSSRVPALGGYTYQDGTDGIHTAGYFADTARKAHDFQRGPSGLGLVVAQQDPLQHTTEIEYDPFQLLPLKVTDPVGLEINASYNFRTLQGAQTTDANGNSIAVEYNPIGLVTKTWVRGKQANEGDAQEPSVEVTYDFLTYHRSKLINPGNPQPIFTRTVRRLRHDTDPDDIGETIESVEYSDGFGRLVQTRTQAEDVLYGDQTFGTNVLSTDIKTTPGIISGTRALADDPPNVVVSGWQVYDNKGRVIQKYEPFFDKGWDFNLPEDSQLGKKVTMFYDPRGQVIRTLNPDGSEQRVIYGIPHQIDQPPLTTSDTNAFRPTPWEAFTYDANDNAGRTHAATSDGYRHHWNTPASMVIDALGRTIEQIQRNRNAVNGPIELHRTRTTYDIRGKVIAITDPLGREAFRHVFDLANRRLRLDSTDAGLRLTFFDAAGKLVETRDSKGSFTLRAYDDANRPTYLWARDNSNPNEQVSLREQFEYGDSLQDQNDARNRNLRGKLYEQRDESGQVTFERYDFKGNISDKVRRVLEPSQLISSTFRVNWGPGNEPQLSLDEYQTTITYDALNRMTSFLYPRDVDGNRKEFTPTYNRAGALESVSMNGDTYVQRIAYNAKGQRTLVAYGNRILTTAEYDETTFRLTRMWTSGFNRPGGSDTSYLPTGPPLQNFSYSYDLSGNLINLIEAVPSCGVRSNPDADASRFSNLRTELRNGDALVREFEYDALYRLTKATGREANNIPSSPPWPDDFQIEGFNWGIPAVPTPGNAERLTAKYVQTYTYDPAGNMMKLSHNGAGLPWARNFGMSGFTPEDWRNKVDSFMSGGVPNWGTGGNRLSNFGTPTNPVTHQYDANGNMIREFGNRVFEWDHSDRLRSFRELDGAGNPSKIGRYLYDSAGQRVVKRAEINGRVEITIYVDGLFEHRISDAEENNSLHVMDNQSRIAMVRIGAPLQGDTGPTVQYHLGDHLGSSNIVVGGNDAQASNVVNREEFFPYGETSFGSFAKKRYRFTGRERDEESKLNFHTARFYVPWLMRWLSCDPLGAGAGLNPFIYANNRPLILQDTSGTLQELPPQAGQSLGRYIFQEAVGLGSKVGAGPVDLALPLLGLVGLFALLLGSSSFTHAQFSDRVTEEGKRRNEDRRREWQQAAERYRRGYGDTLLERGIIDEQTRDRYIRTGTLSFRWEAPSGDRGFLFVGSAPDLLGSFLAYQLYMANDIHGNVLYVGKSGGAHGTNPQNFFERMKQHIKDGDLWTAEVHSVTVISGLNEMEVFAAEQFLIKSYKEKGQAVGNKDPGEFTKRFPGGNLEANAQDALSARHNTYTFKMNVLYDQSTLIDMLLQEERMTEDTVSKTCVPACFPSGQK